jgi:hypothetical protein
MKYQVMKMKRIAEMKVSSVNSTMLRKKMGGRRNKFKEGGKI